MTFFLAWALFGAFGLGFAAGRWPPRGRRGDNVVRGMLLPHPSDERWGLAEVCGQSNVCRNDQRCWSHMQLGADVDTSVVVHERGLVTVGGVRQRGADWRRYARATFHAQADRRALAAATGEP